MDFINILLNYGWIGATLLIVLPVLVYKSKSAARRNIYFITGSVLLACFVAFAIYSILINDPNEYYSCGLLRGTTYLFFAVLTAVFFLFVFWGRGNFKKWSLGVCIFLSVILFGSFHQQFEIIYSILLTKPEVTKIHTPDFVFIVFNSVSIAIMAVLLPIIHKSKKLIKLGWVVTAFIALFGLISLTVANGYFKQGTVAALTLFICFTVPYALAYSLKFAHKEKWTLIAGYAMLALAALAFVIFVFYSKNVYYEWLRFGLLD